MHRTDTRNYKGFGFGRVGTTTTVQADKALKHRSVQAFGLQGRRGSDWEGTKTIKHRSTGTRNCKKEEVRIEQVQLDKAKAPPYRHSKLQRRRGSE